MTVIFHTHAYNTPMLIGDLLISSEESDNDSVLKLPGHIAGIDEIFPKGSGYVPKQMRRKVFIVNSKIAVGVSGNVVHMRAFVEDLRSAFGTDPDFKFQALQEFLQNYQSDDHGKIVFNHILALILYRIDEKTGFVVAGDGAKQNCTELETRSFGKVVAIGGGQDTLKSEINRLDGYSHGFSENFAGSPQYVALSKNLCLLSQLHTIDSITGRSLLEYWGGGYEVIYYDQTGGFRFLEEYTLVFWLLDLDDPSSSLMPRGLLRYERRSEYSLIFSYENQKFEVFGFTDIADPPPKDATIPSGDITFNSDIFVNLVITTRASQALNIYHFVDRHTDDHVGTVFTEIREDSRLEILSHSELSKWVSDHIRATENAGR